MSVTAHEGAASRQDGFREHLNAFRELLDRPLTSYYLILGCSALLLALGLMMVLSASSIEALQETGSPFYLVLQAVDLGRDRHPADVDLRAAAAAVLPARRTTR